MRRFFALGLVATLLAGGLNMSSAADLKAGDDAPEFKLTGSDGKTYRRSDFKDKQAVVLAWFPKALTAGGYPRGVTRGLVPEPKRYRRL